MFEEKISLILLAYNEQQVIEKVIREYYNKIFEKLPAGSELIVYLDKPTDGTAPIARKLEKELNIRVVEGEENLGYAGAMKSALKQAKNEIIFFSDANGKHRADDFWTLIPMIKSADIVTGLRKPRYDPLIRRFISFMQRVITSLLFWVPFLDYNTGYKIVKKSVLDDVLDECKYMKQSFSSELLLRAYYKKYKIVQGRVEFKDREADKATATNFKKLPKIIWRSLMGYVKLFFELHKF
jgi:glycosyltransferase involved in cell wall biosynthesis